jgi:hypothetical protein
VSDPIIYQYEPDVAAAREQAPAISDRTAKLIIVATVVMLFAASITLLRTVPLDGLVLLMQEWPR